MKCPLCNRPMDEDNSNEHHLIPKSRKGKEVVRLHIICHNQIHALLTEYELEHFYNTIDAIKSYEPMKNFIRWVSKKDPKFYEKTKLSNRRKR